MTSTFWPMSHSASPCTMPTEMIKACKSFEQFYLARHNGRRLTWQPSLGNADVRVTFKARAHDLNVSTFALVILLLFQDVKDGDFLTYDVMSLITTLNIFINVMPNRISKQQLRSMVMSSSAIFNR